MFRPLRFALWLSLNCLFVIAWVIYLNKLSAPLLYSADSLLEVDLYDTDTIVLDNELEVEAASSQRFLFDNKSYSLIYSIKKETPLGWPYPEYWVSKKLQYMQGSGSYVMAVV